MLLLLIAPFIALSLIYLLLYTPIDYIYYRKSRFYKDTRKKYIWLSGKLYTVKLYEIIRAHNLPIEYHEVKSSTYTNFGYFLYKDALIIHDLKPVFNEESNTWEAEASDRYSSLEKIAAEYIQEFNELIKGGIAKKALVFVDSVKITKNSPLKLSNCELLPIDNSNPAPALKNYIANSP